MAPARPGRRRMGGCETHSADHAHPGNQPPTPAPANPQQALPRSRSSAAACRRQARSSSPAPAGAALRALQLDPGPRDGTKPAATRKSHNTVPTQPGGHSRSPGQIHHALLTKRPPWVGTLRSTRGRSSAITGHAKSARESVGWTLCLTLSDRPASWARRRPRGYVYCAGRCELRLSVLGTVRIRPLLACGGCTGRIVRPFHASGTGMSARMRCRNALIHSPAWPGRV